MPRKKKRKLTAYIEQWEEVKVLIKAIELDLYKNANGNLSAGIRARHGLRLIKSLIHEIQMNSLEKDKILTELRKKSKIKKAKKEEYLKKKQLKN
jgi:hypothetical protein